MIRIELESTIKDDIEVIHWKWFSKRMEQKAWPNGQTHKDFIFAHVNFLKTDEQHLLNIAEQDKMRNDRLHDLIIGDPNSSDDKIKKFDFFQQINRIYHWHNVGKIKDPQKKDDAEKENQLIDDLQKAFGYDDFVSSPQDEQWYKDFKANNGGNDWNIKVLSEKLNTDVCPYCNRQYIFGYEIKDKKKNTIKRNTAEIDHFNPKSHYPYLSCSLYNFVPSCHTCNSIKQAQDKKILYPYTDSLDDYTGIEKNATFTFKAKDGSQLTFPINKNTPKDIELKINPNYSKKDEADESKKLFHLDEIYSKHILELNDIIERYESCTPKQLQAIYNFVTDGLKINISEENLKKLILGLPINTTKEYPLRKFKEDIIDYISKIDQNMIK